LWHLIGLHTESEREGEAVWYRATPLYAIRNDFQEYKEGECWEHFLIKCPLCTEDFEDINRELQKAKMYRPNVVKRAYVDPGFTWLYFWKHKRKFLALFGLVFVVGGLNLRKVLDSIPSSLESAKDFVVRLNKRLSPSMF